MVTVTPPNKEEKEKEKEEEEANKASIEGEGGVQRLGTRAGGRRRTCQNRYVSAWFYFTAVQNVKIVLFASFSTAFIFLNLLTISQISNMYQFS